MTRTVWATAAKKFDRSIVEGPIGAAVWKLAWPTVLQNVIGGLQGIIDHAMVGHYVGFTGNAAIGVSFQIFLVVVVFLASLFSGMGVLVARFTGAGDADDGQSRGVAGVSGGDQCCRSAWWRRSGTSRRRRCSV